MTIAYIVPSLKNKLFMLSKECSGSSETILKFIVLTFNKSSLFETFTDCYAYVLISGVTRVGLGWAEPNPPIIEDNKSNECARHYSSL
jgi:hypothetical protein